MQKRDNYPFARSAGYDVGVSRHPPRGSGEDTVDPVIPSRADDGLAAEVAFVEIVFHSDLRLVGARALLGSRKGRGQPAVTIGREQRVFERDGATEALADPCVSRRQLEVRWHGDEELFQVARDVEARREVCLWRASHLVSKVAWPANGRVPPGSLISLGDRVLLRLDCAPVDRKSSLGLLGVGRGMHDVRQSVRTLAQSASSVLVLGETGTGKELVARALHTVGPRAKEPFCPVNCAALPDTLLEAELFGFERGAFSHATTSRDGLLRAAGRGTVFLDEIGELSLGAQAKILRALQERRVRPIGSPVEVPFNAAIVMATHRDLEADVAAGRFRADLYARVEAPRLTLPPLRERREDVPRLFAHFLGRHVEGSASVRGFCSADAHPPPITMASFLRLMSHDWPRNVRELEKLASRVALDLRTNGAVDDRLFPEDPARPVSVAEGSPAAKMEGRPSADELLALLDGHDFVQNRLAKSLGISRTTLDKWMREAGVRRPSDVDREEIVAVLARRGGDVVGAARELRVSSRGLRLRLRELALRTDG